MNSRMERTGDPFETNLKTLDWCVRHSMLSVCGCIRGQERYVQHGKALRASSSIISSTHMADYLISVNSSYSVLAGPARFRARN